MNPLAQLLNAARILRQLGPRQTGLYAWYRLGLFSGYLRRQTPGPPDGDQPGRLDPAALVMQFWLPIPDRTALLAVLDAEAQTRLSAEANEIVAGQVNLFGGGPAPLQLAWPGPLQHWSEYEKHPELLQQWFADRAGLNPTAIAWPGIVDVKYIWEPARFGWAYPLGRAYVLSGDEAYAEAFWCYAERFLEANPTNQGPNWLSAQEAALRLMAFVFSAQVLARSSHSTPARLARLGAAIAAHAARIPPTLAYARSQHNNHLLVEAAGLITAALTLPDHPGASRWLALGRRWFNAGLQAQIAADGSYAQHSINYHRLALHIALWINALGAARPDNLLEPASLEKLAVATRWLLALSDPLTGHVPNLGPNDGACILPLSSCAFADYRPVLQAAALAFLGERLYAPGPWDELSLWLSGSLPSRPSGEQNAPQPAYHLSGDIPAVTRLSSTASWAYLRVASFTSRPGHADQLHLDLWWRGLNLAQDAGTYSYNAPPPWDNALARTSVHNTLTVDGRDQMTRAGRFLWLDWAQGYGLSRSAASEPDPQTLSARHNGYRHLGVLHQRTVIAYPGDHWTVEDRLLPLNEQSSGTSIINIRLHWLLPDWPWEIDAGQDGQVNLMLHSPYGKIGLTISASDPTNLTLIPQLTRAGELLFGLGPVSPTWGWFSPTYGSLLPALACAVTAAARLPAGLTSDWRLPE